MYWYPEKCQLNYNIVVHACETSHSVYLDAAMSMREYVLIHVWSNDVMPTVNDTEPPVWGCAAVLFVFACMNLWNECVHLVELDASVIRRLIPWLSFSKLLDPIHPSSLTVHMFVSSLTSNASAQQSLDTSILWLLNVGPYMCVGQLELISNSSTEESQSLYACLNHVLRILL